MKKTFTVAITGGIGSGKSLACSIIKKMGYNVTSADQVVQSLYKKRWFLKKIKEIFPTAVSGRFFLKVDKTKISKIVFEDKQKLNELNALIHPLVFTQLTKTSKRGLNFVEIPLLFETQMQNSFDGVIIVMRPIKKRIESVINRSSLTEEQVKKRISSQVDYCKVDKTPYTVVGNCGDLQTFTQSIISAVKQFEDKVNN